MKQSQVMQQKLHKIEDMEILNQIGAGKSNQ